MKAIILFPSYGATYKDRQAIVAAWEAGKDFHFPGGPYCSVRDLEALKRIGESISLVDPITRVSVQVWNYATIL